MVWELPPAYSTLREPSVKLQIRDTVDMTNVFGDELVLNCSFENKNTRIAFTQKVLSIALLQKLAVNKMLFYFNTDFSIRTLTVTYFKRYLLCTGLVYLVTLFLMIYCKEARKRTPYIYMFLVLYPVTLGFFLNSLSNAFFIFDAIYIATGFFCNVLLALLIYSVFALNHSIKFTVKAGIYISMVLLIVSFEKVDERKVTTEIWRARMSGDVGRGRPKLEHLIQDQNPTINGRTFAVITAFWFKSATIPYLIYPEDPYGMLYTTLAVFLLSSYILLDLEAMVSKTNRHELTPADFLLGALMLHIDFRHFIMKVLKPIDPYSIFIFILVSVTALSILGIKII